MAPRKKPMNLKKRNLSDETIKSFRLGYSFNKKSSLYQYLKSLSFQDDEILKSNVVKKDKNNNLIELVKNKKNQGYGGVQKIAYNIAIKKKYE